MPKNFTIIIFFWGLVVYGSVQYVILASKYMRILQEKILQKFIQINNEINKKHKLNYESLEKYYRRYILANRELIQINLCIQSYARYCAFILSIVFPFYISGKWVGIPNLGSYFLK